jgi:hypothetical protein
LQPPWLRQGIRDQVRLQATSSQGPRDKQTSWHCL